MFITAGLLQCCQLFRICRKNSGFSTFFRISSGFRNFPDFLYFLLNYIWFILNVKNKTFHSATAAYCCVVKNILSKDNVLINSKYYNLSFFICLVYCTFEFEIDFPLLYWNWNMFLCENDNEWYHYENDIEKLVLDNTN